MACIFILFIACYAQSYFKPFLDDRYDFIEALALLVATTTMYLGLWTFYIREDNSVLAYSITAAIYFINGVWIFYAAIIYFRVSGLADKAKRLSSKIVSPRLSLINPLMQASNSSPASPKNTAEVSPEMGDVTKFDYHNSKNRNNETSIELVPIEPGYSVKLSPHDDISGSIELFVHTVFTKGVVKHISAMIFTFEDSKSDFDLHSMNQRITPLLDFFRTSVTVMYDSIDDITLRGKVLCWTLHALIQKLIQIAAFHSFLNPLLHDAETSTLHPFLSNSWSTSHFDVSDNNPEQVKALLMDSTRDKIFMINKHQWNLIRHFCERLKTCSVVTDVPDCPAALEFEAIDNLLMLIFEPSDVIQRFVDGKKMFKEIPLDRKSFDSMRSIDSIDSFLSRVCSNLTFQVEVQDAQLALELRNKSPGTSLEVEEYSA